MNEKQKVLAAFRQYRHAALVPQHKRIGEQSKHGEIIAYGILDGVETYWVLGDDLVVRTYPGSEL